MGSKLQVYLKNVGLIIFLIFISVAPVLADAGTTYGGSTSLNIDQISKNIVDTVFISWRFPISAVLIILAVANNFSSDPSGKRKSAQYVVGTLIYFMLPYLINVVQGWGGK